MSEFGDRLAELFAGRKQREIAETLGVTDAAVRNYLGGRVPDLEKLQLISDETGCNLHWLLTGEGDPKLAGVTEQTVRFAGQMDSIEDRVRQIIREEKSVSQIAQVDDIRAMIRAIVVEELGRSRRKRPFMDLDFGHGEDEVEKVPGRKAG